MVFQQAFARTLLTVFMIQVVKGHIVLEESLKTFLGTLEWYSKTENDVVFLLDESGSITAEKFIEVKMFAQLTAQRLAVAPEFSRVAVVTFATDTITHINYIKYPEGNNMCTLLADIEKIGYVGEWTHTDIAMIKAREILAQGRLNSNRIIVLLSDGQSNAGHSPLRISRELKSEGVIIFAVGVAEVNNEEIYAVASSPEHVYILTNFANISKLNVQLRGDLHEHSMDLVDSSYCDSRCEAKTDCCDNHAKCYCGASTGIHECACVEGYHGKGYKGKCYKCPKGTYKSKAFNSDCETCPDHSTTLEEGSTKFEDCICERGYEKHGNFCAPVKCAELSPPDGGFLIPSHCNNTYGSQCSFKCRAGFCPYSCSANNFLQYSTQVSGVAKLPARICLETGKWTGEEFFCEKMTCLALHSPFNGKHNCSEKDFTYGTTCHFECNKGFELSGSEFRTCLINGSWTGMDVHCKDIQCDPLKTNALLYVKPETCGTKPMKFRSVCTYGCKKGFTLVSESGNSTNGQLTCGANKKWLGEYNKISCKDTTPPKISCQKPIIIDALPGKGYAEVNWEPANATDNNYISPSDVIIIEPKNVKPPFDFLIGQTKIVYEAKDAANYTNTCSFTVTVLDKESPRVISCPSDIEVYHNKKETIPVFWEEPQFEDNSKVVSIKRLDTRSGQGFGWGHASIIQYMATDEAGNAAFCNFTVKVKPYPCPYYKPPANGALTCDNWMDGRLCSVHCHEGFKLADGRNSNTMYVCNRINRGGKLTGEWEPLDRNMRRFKMPWPDCSKIQKPAALNVSVSINYKVNACSEEAIRKVKENFLNSLQGPFAGVFCPEGSGCHSENVNVTCGPANQRIKRHVNINERWETYSSRNYRIKRQSPQQVLTITYSIKMPPNITEATEIADDKNTAYQSLKLDSNPIFKEIQHVTSQNVKEVYNLESTPEPNISYDVMVICTIGQIEVNNSCVNCPAGTYKEPVSGTCKECRKATYQDEEGQLSCKPCPKDFTTHEVKSTAFEDCKGPCKPGTYSSTTFEPCLACPLNTYQSRSARKDCLKCPQGLFTWKVGSNSTQDCVAPCKAGFFSGTGYEPCKECPAGFFQEKEKQNECLPCPGKTYTLTNGSKSITDCKEIDICEVKKPCPEGSTCIPIEKDYKCKCPEGLEGAHCEINVDECAYIPCLNNGTCIDGVGNFTCECLAGWTGHRCEINIDDCKKNPCRNGADCIDLLNAYECQCRPGFTGTNCEINIDECLSNPCRNNGTCFDMENGYRCCCGKDYYGTNCEHEFVIDFCESVSCMNGGTCFPTDSGFNCSCLPGFDGIYCENNINDCLGFECDNGGTCVDGINTAICVCPKEFIGVRCKEAIIPQYSLNFPQPPSTSNYVELKNNHLLSAITVSFFMATDFKDPNIRSTPVSYSYIEKGAVVDNALTFFDTNNFVLYIHGEAFYTEYKANSDPYWHHYALTWEKVGGKWVFYVDGKNVASDIHVGEEKYMRPGIFILGQEQDAHGDVFSALEAFSGSITEFNVWDYALSQNEIKKLSSSCGYIGNVIPWYIARTFIQGNVTQEEALHCSQIDQCSKESCDCIYSNQSEENSCKHEVEECKDDSCANDQPCLRNEYHSFCNCSSGFEGRRCEHDVDECSEDNGGCKYFCVNKIGSYHCECPEGMLLSEDGISCRDTAFCNIDGQIYPNGDTWLRNDCESCTCDHGYVQCMNITCNQTICLSEGENLIKVPGECCPKCAAAWAYCSALLNGTITTFDISTYDVDGECTYTVVEDCIHGHFKVQIESLDNRTNVKQLVIYEDCTRLVVNSEEIRIDERTIDVLFENNKISIEKDNSTIKIKTQSGLLVYWHMEGAMIAVPITQVNGMCGLCNQLQSNKAGKYPLPKRTVSGESDCFMIVRESEENNASSIGDQMFLLYVLLIVCAYMNLLHHSRYI